MRARASADGDHQIDERIDGSNGLVHFGQFSRQYAAVSDRRVSDRRLSAHRVSLQLVHDREHYALVIDQLMRRAAVSIWIATANVKELHIEAPIGSQARARGRYQSIVTLFADLARRDVEVRVLHAGTPSRRFDAARRRLDDAVSDRIELRQCPRTHLKMIAIDGTHLYLGSANLTGAGLGAKEDNRRNFETGILTDDETLLDEMQARMDHIWSGRACTGCRLRAECPAPLDGQA